MSDNKVVPFPRRDYHSWLNWVECELSILGFEISSHTCDWKSLFDRGLRPETAASQAARQFAAT
jgi:hypothetical protein